MKRTLFALQPTVVLVAFCLMTTFLTAQGTPLGSPQTGIPGGAAGNPGSVVSNPAPMAGNPAPSAPAQANAPQIPVAVVDYDYLMIIHPKLAAEKAAQNQNNQQLEAKFMAEYQDLQARGKAITTVNPGTKEYSDRMDKQRRDEADWQLRMQSAKEAVILQRLELEYAAFYEIKVLVDNIAKRNNIIIVLNYINIARRLPDEVTPSAQTKDVEMGNQLQMPIAWVHPNVDLTVVVEKTLNDTWGPKGYAAVNFKALKDQLSGNAKPAGTVPTTGTNVATAPVGSGTVVRQN